MGNRFGFRSQRDLSSFLLRFFIGLIFTVHGVGKVFVYGGIAETAANFVTEKHFPAWTAYASIFLEAIAGVLLLIGFQIRMASLMLIPVAVGIIIYHFPFGWVFSSPGGGWEYPQFLLISLMVIFLNGPDPYSLDGRNRPIKN